MPPKLRKDQRKRRILKLSQTDFSPLKFSDSTPKDLQAVYRLRNSYAFQCSINSLKAMSGCESSQSLFLFAYSAMTKLDSFLKIFKNRFSV